jgi:N-acetylgalactosamine-N,N'-diacetylbacillosaminyl-diphospho-undecaprenol 4-alpha-N-acetylgalactosaminyltransferase
MKKLSIFIYSLGGGGAEKAALELCVGLHESYDVRLILFSDVIKYDLPDGIKYEVLDSFDFYANPLKKLLKLPLLAYKYARYCRQSGIDISLSFLSRPNIISVMSMFFGNQAKIILSEHSTLSHYYGQSLAERALKKIIKILYPKADKIVAVSSGAKDDLIASFGVASEKIDVVYNPIDIEKIRAMSREVVGFEKSGFTMMTCGRLIESKNVEMLIRSFAFAGIDDSRLMILGDGEERQKLQELATTIGVGEKVHFVGFTQNPYAYMSMADVFVFGSRLEALPTVLIEALVCDLPIISTDCPSGPDEILYGMDYAFENGIKKARYWILTKMDDIDAMQRAMNLIYEDVTMRNEYKNRACIRAKDFAKETIFEKYKAILG